MADEPDTFPETAALAERPAAELPRLVTPRAATLRAIGVVMIAELIMFGGLILTNSVWGSIALGIGGILLWSFHRRAETQRAIAETEKGRELLDLNRVDEAAAALDEVLARKSTPAHARPLAAFNRALVAVRRARYDEARARLDAVLDSGWLANRKFLQNLSPAVHASAMLVAVLQGDLEAAERYHQKGRRTAFDLERHWFVAESFELARRERWSELLTKFERCWEAIEGTVSGTGIRQLQLLKAYALARIGEQEDNYRGLHSGDEVRALLHGIRPGRFDHLAAQWPELREFMQAHRLMQEPS